MPTLEKMAREKNFELISLTKSACPGPAVVKVNTGEYKNSDCSAWRDYAYKRITSIQVAPKIRAPINPCADPDFIDVIALQSTFEIVSAI